MSSIWTFSGLHNEVWNIALRTLQETFVAFIWNVKRWMVDELEWAQRMYNSVSSCSVEDGHHTELMYLRICCHFLCSPILNNKQWSPLLFRYIQGQITECLFQVRLTFGLDQLSDPSVGLLSPCSVNLFFFWLYFLLWITVILLACLLRKQGHLREPLI